MFFFYERPWELLWVLLDTHTRTRNFGEFSMPVQQYRVRVVQRFCTCTELLWVVYVRATIPRTSVSSISRSLSYPYPELLYLLYNMHWRTRNCCMLCIPRATIPGVKVQLFYPRTELLWVLSTCVKIPTTFVRSVTLSYPHPELLKVMYASHTRTLNSRTLLNTSCNNPMAYEQ